jgi:hypothetical protein
MGTTECPGHACRIERTTQWTFSSYLEVAYAVAKLKSPILLRYTRRRGKYPDLGGYNHLGVFHLS